MSALATVDLLRSQLRLGYYVSDPPCCNIAHVTFHRRPIQVNPRHSDHAPLAARQPASANHALTPTPCYRTSRVHPRSLPLFAFTSVRRVAAQTTPASAPPKRPLAVCAGCASVGPSFHRGAGGAPGGAGNQAGWRRQAASRATAECDSSTGAAVDCGRWAAWLRVASGGRAGDDVATPSGRRTAQATRLISRPSSPVKARLVLRGRRRLSGCHNLRTSSKWHQLAASERTQLDSTSTHPSSSHEPTPPDPNNSQSALRSSTADCTSSRVCLPARMETPKEAHVGCLLCGGDCELGQFFRVVGELVELAGEVFELALLG